MSELRKELVRMSGDPKDRPVVMRSRSMSASSFAQVLEQQTVVTEGEAFEYLRGFLPSTVSDAHISSSIRAIEAILSREHNSRTSFQELLAGFVEKKNPRLAEENRKLKHNAERTVQRAGFLEAKTEEQESEIEELRTRLAAAKYKLEAASDIELLTKRIELENKQRVDEAEARENAAHERNQQIQGKLKEMEATLGEMTARYQNGRDRQQTLEYEVQRLEKEIVRLTDCELELEQIRSRAELGAETPSSIETMRESLLASQSKCNTLQNQLDEYAELLKTSRAETRKLHVAIEEMRIQHSEALAAGPNPLSLLDPYLSPRSKAINPRGGDIDEFNLLSPMGPRRDKSHTDHGVVSSPLARSQLAPVDAETQTTIVVFAEMSVGSSDHPLFPEYHTINTQVSHFDLTPLSTTASNTAPPPQLIHSQTDPFPPLPTFASTASETDPVTLPTQTSTGSDPIPELRPITPPPPPPPATPHRDTRDAATSTPTKQPQFSTSTLTDPLPVVDPAASPKQTPRLVLHSSTNTAAPPRTLSAATGPDVAPSPSHIATEANFADPLIPALRATIEDLKNQLRLRPSPSGAAGHLATQLTDARAQITQLKQRIAQLESELAVANGLHREQENNPTLEERCADLEAQIRRKEEQVIGMHKDISRLSSESLRAGLACKKWESIARDLEIRLAALQADRNTIASHQSQLMLTQLETLSQSIRLLDTQSETELQNTQLLAMLDALPRDVFSLIMQRDSAWHAQNERDHKRDQEDWNMISLRNERDSLRRERDTLQERLRYTKPADF